MNKVFEQHNQEQQDYVDGLREINAELLEVLERAVNRTEWFMAEFPHDATESDYEFLDTAKAAIARARKS